VEAIGQPLPDSRQPHRDITTGQAGYSLDLRCLQAFQIEQHKPSILKRQFPDEAMKRLLLLRFRKIRFRIARGVRQISFIFDRLFAIPLPTAFRDYG
jgi:hypothetical protein